MKKKYISPEVSVICLSMEQAICASCGISATFAEHVCSVDIPGLGAIFTEDMDCMFTNDADVCYHTPIASGNVFSS